MATRKRIHNPKTQKYYSLRQKTTKLGKKGQIKGGWSPIAKAVDKRLTFVLKKLATQ